MPTWVDTDPPIVRNRIREGLVLPVLEREAPPVSDACEGTLLMCMEALGETVRERRIR